MCVYCLLSNQAVQIAKLKSTLAQLTSKLSNDSSNLPALPITPTNLPDGTAAVPTKPDKPKPSMVHSQKKFNIVVYGIALRQRKNHEHNMTYSTLLHHYQPLIHP